VLYDQGRYEEALEVTGVLDEVSRTPDVALRSRLLSVRAKLLAQTGRVHEAEAMAREAVALVEPTDRLPNRGDVLMDLAEVLRLAGRPADAIVPLREARRLYEQKGDVVSAGKACALLADLESSARLGTRP
jgi:tetratricopeptide (TPR) repeat protein